MRLLAMYREVEDLVQIGDADVAIGFVGEIRGRARRGGERGQGPQEPAGGRRQGGGGGGASRPGGCGDRCSSGWRRRGGLVVATTRRRAVELLRERRYEAWLGAERAKEARALDELVTARYGRDGTGDGAMA